MRPFTQSDAMSIPK